MDITKILDSIKGKVLDDSNFKLLKNAYEKQNENLAQLKHNNDALAESNDLLEQKIRELSDENSILKETIEKYKNQAESIFQTSLMDDLSEIAINILKLYISNNTTEMWEKFIMRSLPFSEVQVQGGLDELCKAELISSYSFDPSHGKEYSLTDKGVYNLSGKK